MLFADPTSRGWGMLNDPFSIPSRSGERAKMPPSLSPPRWPTSTYRNLEISNHTIRSEKTATESAPPEKMGILANVNLN